MSFESCRQVHLSSDLFQIAIDRYIDCNKPDHLARKQLEGWSFQWCDEKLETKNDDNFVKDPSHKLQGTLEIGGEFMVIHLQIVCMWNASASNSDNSDKNASVQYGDFFFSCHAHARFWTNSEWKEKGKQNTDKKDKKIQDKIRSKIITRLQEDAYISKLLATTNLNVESQQSASNDVIKRSLLAQANIHFSPSSLEERVTVSDDVCEAIKRAIWSSAESPLDVVEVILHLPFLPTTDHASSEDTASPIVTTSLANRAKLRLLEDAMCDACEREGEEEILDDLKISDPDKAVDNQAQTTSKFDPKSKGIPPKTKKSDGSLRKRAKASSN